MKKCDRCKIEKPLDAFYKMDYPNARGKDGRLNICKPCKIKRSLETKRQREYGLSTEDVEEMLKSQEGNCKICKTDLSDLKYFCVDHCHKTKKVRGLLCNTCNRALGLFKDDLNVLERAVDYLKEQF